MESKKGMMWACAMALAPALSWAGGSAVLESGADADGRRTAVEFDGAQLRVGVLGQADAYMIIRDGKVYSVSQRGGQPVVMDLSGVGQMLAGMMDGAVPGANGKVEQFLGLEATGRTETIAGIKGRVHRLSYIDDAGQRRDTDIVLAKDPRLQELMQSMNLMSRTLAQALGQPVSEGNERMTQKILGQGEGMLRFGDEFRVASIDGGTPAGSRFALPVQPQAMPDLGSLMSGAQAEASASGSASGGNPLSGLFGSKAERQRERIEGRTDQEVDQATDEAVDKALDKAFDKLFGR